MSDNVKIVEDDPSPGDDAIFQGPHSAFRDFHTNDFNDLIASCTRAAIQSSYGDDSWRLTARGTNHSDGAYTPNVVGITSDMDAAVLYVLTGEIP